MAILFTIRTFIIEAVYPVDAGTLVISPQQKEVLRIFDFVCEQQTDGLQALLASINVVTKEQVVSLRWKPSVLEESQQICVLPMDVT